MKQLAFRLPAVDLLPGEIIVDSFAGGGGASIGIEAALGRSPDIAINHDPAAIAMHEVNHPATRHFQESVWTVKPKVVTGGANVGLLWASPDCRHFSRAKGGKPVSPRVRGLAWVVVAWARAVAPRVICLENVPEFLTWGPLGPDNMPIKARAGETFARWAGQLERLGYRLEKKVLNAADFGAPTSRKRIFIVARRDGQPIRWPEPSHGPGRPRPWRTAAECIDWSIPCRSIFDRERPLAPATEQRIAFGLPKFVGEPFLVNLTHGGRVESLREPMRTVTGANRGEKALAVPYLIQMGYGERRGQAPRVLDINAPLGTVVASGGKFALVAAFLNKHYGGVVGQSLHQPLGTVTKVDHHSLAAVFLTKFRANSVGQGLGEPLHTVTAGAGGAGGHFGLVAAFLLKYYGTALGQPLNAPLGAITSRDRFSLVLVRIAGVEYAIADILMRMLAPHELAWAQGFPRDYILTGTKSERVAKIGNSVCPPVAEALVRANLVTQAAAVRAEAVA